MADDDVDLYNDVVYNPTDVNTSDLTPQGLNYLSSVPPSANIPPPSSSSSVPAYPVKQPPVQQPIQQQPLSFQQPFQQQLQYQQQQQQQQQAPTAVSSLYQQPGYQQAQQPTAAYRTAYVDPMSGIHPPPSSALYINDLTWVCCGIRRVIRSF